MSTLRTNALEGVDAKNSITIVAGAGNITTTNVQEGLCKSWVNLNTSSTASTRDTFNVSGITDNSTGNTTVSVTNNFANVNFAYSVASSYTSSNQGVHQEVHEGGIATSSYGVGTFNLSNSSADSENVFSLVAGDLA